MTENIKGKLAVVTGASSGIGLCFCRELASRGCNLLMISNQREELGRCADDIARSSDVAAYPLFVDLTSQDAATTILDYMDSKGLEADYLINNAGIFSFLPVVDTAPGKIDCFI